MFRRFISVKLLPVILLLALITALVTQADLGPSTVRADVTPFIPAANAGDLVSYLIADPNIAVSGTPSFTGVITASSRFESVSLGTYNSESYALDRGILVTSGNGLPPLSNTMPNFTGSNGMPGDSDVESFAGVVNSLDAFALQFDFTVPADYQAIEFKFMFASDEYPEYLDNVVDGAAVIVDGVNYAYLPGNIPLKVVTEANLTSNTDGKFSIEYDGVSPPQKIVALLDSSRSTHTIKIVIADTSDMSFDSGLFIANMKRSTATTGGIVGNGPYAVTYHGNGNDGGAVPTDGNSYADAASVTVLDNTGALMKTGYSFAGWCTAADGSGTTYQAGNTYSITGNTDLYAQWTLNNYSITFNSNGGSEVSSVSQGYGTAITPPAAPARSGYTFSGWFPALPTNMPAGNLAVTAQWTQIRYNTDTLQINQVTGLDTAVDMSQDVAAGRDVDVVLEVDLLEENNVPPADKTEVEQKIAAEPKPENVQVLFLDVSLFKITRSENTEATERITQAGNLIRISFLVPEAYRGGKDYRIVRVHDGVVDYLTAEYDPATHLVTFETDKFSTYALTYTLNTEVLPVTGESTAAGTLAGILLLAGAAALVISRRRLLAIITRQ